VFAEGKVLPHPPRAILAVLEEPDGHASDGNTSLIALLG
jgi:hypothetical protein